MPTRWSWPQVARLELLPPEERLNPEKLMQDLTGYRQDRDLSCRTRMRSSRISAKSAQGGDIVCVFSNGGFGGIHGKLLQRLGSI